MGRKASKSTLEKFA
ncbi:unnamed protein product [Timema podura]|uniref:Uncharacterized protein n=1 Tax=Timema podura TaxID=61482 RepID=A0ABN7NUK6_TIMPD|nr:unnamed protein product [Timema podura]